MLLGVKILIIIPNFFSQIIILVFIINFGLSISLIFIEKRDPIKTVAWLLALNLLPIIGFFFYIVLGTRPRFKTNKRFDLKSQNDLLLIEEILHNLSLQETIKNKPIGHDEQKTLNLINLNFGSIKSPYTNDNAVDIYTCGKQKFKQLLPDLKAAENHIHMVYFIYRNDNIGNEIMDILIEKAKKGLDVRLLIDAFGSILTPKKFFYPLIKAGGKVAFFAPTKLHYLPRLNYRQHRKIVIIDGEIAYIGGMNIGDEYRGMKPKQHQWRDTHLRIMGSAVYMLQTRFIMDWNFSNVKETLSLNDAWYPPIKVPPGDLGMQVVSSGPDHPDEHIKYAYIKMIQSADDRIYIQTPYFIPDAPFREAIKTAAYAGVKICIMIPGEYDKYMVYKASLSFVGDLIYYPNIYFYQYNGFLHSKMMVMDDCVATVGTTNIDVRSFALDFEVNSFIYSQDFTQRCCDIFDKDVQNAHLLTPLEFAQRPVRSKFMEAIARILSPVF